MENEQDQSPSNQTPSSDPPPIVAIGASAGGIGALQGLFGNLPGDTGAAFIVVLHLDPQHRSELPAILQARTGMPVVQVEKTARLDPNRVYVIPPDRRLQIIDHQIAAQEFEEPHGQRLPVNLLFRSMAERLGDGFAVILSGSGSDGATGALAVKESGGIVLVQDPNEAEYGSMPRSAIATGAADFIMPVNDLAKRLADLIRIKEVVWPPEALSGDDELLRGILASLRIRTGHDFSKYKRSTVMRRIARRMQVTHSDQLKTYYEIMRSSEDEAQALLRDLLISVTTFFRDKDSFDALAKLLPELFATEPPGEPIRVWSAGCATGEEAYSLAILLLEEAARHASRPMIQIFASDLDVRALASAREGRFPASIEADVSAERLQRFFTRNDDHYRVRQELREMVLFTFHDLLKDPPFSRIDLLSCRNVLIYLDSDLQQQVCSTFYYALNPKGYLFIGGSETADSPSGLFRSVDRTARIYQPSATSGEKPRIPPRLLGPFHFREPTIIQAGQSLSPAQALSEAVIHRRAIEQVAPPSVLVNEAHRAVHFSDNAGRYFLLSGGPLSDDVVDLVRPELRFELRSALHRVFDQQQSTLTLPIPVQFNGAPHPVQMQIKPVQKEGERSDAVVLFIESEEVNQTVSDKKQVTDETVRHLRQELELTQARLRSLREESDAANEELRAANEELQSINEEYRSTSEELETSKEELQSMNEELQTVNSELKLKLDAVSRANSDLQNFVASLDFGMIILDPKLRITRFTDQVRNLFSITLADEGRPITDFAHQLEYNDLISDAKAVIAGLIPIHREIHAHNDRWYDVRLRPYRTADDRIDGVMITFTDITARKLLEDRQKSPS